MREANRHNNFLALCLRRLLEGYIVGIGNILDENALAQPRRFDTRHLKGHLPKQPSGHVKGESRAAARYTSTRRVG